MHQLRYSPARTRKRRSMPTDREETPRLASDAGLTLIEMLVMLVIAGVVAAVSIEAIRVASSNGIRVSRAAREATGGSIDLAGLRSMIEASRADYVGDDGQFRGQEDGFSSTTSTPLSGRLGEPQTYTLVFESEPSSAWLRLVYSDGRGDIVVGRWPDASGSFQYYVEEETSLASAVTSRAGDSPAGRRRQWLSTWPDTSLEGAYYVSLPLAVKIEVKPQSGDPVAMIVGFPITAPPPQREQDLLGDIGPG